MKPPVFDRAVFFNIQAKRMTQKRDKISYWDALTDEEIKEFLKKEVTCRLALSLNDKPYIVPLAYIYYEDKIYLHWFTGRGLKDEYAEKNPQVCFEVDIYSESHLFFKSVIAFGVLKKVGDYKRRKEVLQEFSKKYPEYATGAGHPWFVRLIMQKGLSVTARVARIYEIEVEKITGVIQDIKL